MNNDLQVTYILLHDYRYQNFDMQNYLLAGII